ncbi:hypothetical protein OHB01_08475 [Microbispora hainanensis]|uniref:Uncharacterized protein n=1 Tax=Microbispora hainanensis TaxID=568844 RepID=A0ABZ1SLM5_9ACTN|nr:MULTISPECIES: hypothetical protein [Microbispora]NJP29118.1 hypothetical protein [Microbispora sp. CL1-1]
MVGKLAEHDQLVLGFQPLERGDTLRHRTKTLRRFIQNDRMLVHVALPIITAPR